METLYEGILKNSKETIKKFFKNVASVVKRKAKDIYYEIDRKYGNHKKRSNFIPGKLLHFRYEAKHREKIFDRNPLVICLGPSKKFPKTHFLGINIHWLPMRDRVAIASFFLELRRKRKGKLVYEDIKPFINKFKGHPALRMYIISHVSNKVIEIPDDEMYLVAAGLPTEMFTSYAKAVMSQPPASKKAKEKKKKGDIEDLIGKTFKTKKIEAPKKTKKVSLQKKIDDLIRSEYKKQNVNSMSQEERNQFKASLKKRISDLIDKEI